MRIIITICVLLVSGCTKTMLVHPTKNTADYNRDMYVCKQEAAQYAASLGAAMNPFIINPRIEECMNFKFGWSIQKKGDSLAKQNTEDLSYTDPRYGFCIDEAKKLAALDPEFPIDDIYEKCKKGIFQY
jgi:hypothetical protein